MTKKRMNELVVEVQEIMLCPQWNITVYFDDLSESENGNLAFVAWDRCYDNSDLHLFGWEDWDEEMARHILMHEFGHLLMRDLQCVIGDLKEHMPKRVWQALWDRFNHEQEGVVDRYATIIQRAERNPRPKVRS